MFEFALSANYLHSLHKDLDTKEAISDRSQWDRILKNVYESFFCENASQPVELSNLVSSANRGGQWGVRSTNSKLVLQKVIGQTLQGQTASGRPKENFCHSAESRRELLKKVYFCRNTETTERSCFCRNTVFRQKQPLSAGKSCYFILISTKFRLKIVLIFV